MAVFTPVSHEAAQSFLKDYRIGILEQIQPILEGWENSNFFLRTSQGDFVLTLVEGRTRQEDLPWLIGLMNHLKAEHFACPRIEADQKGQYVHLLNGRPALIATFLKGRNNLPITGNLCFLFGRAMAQMHLAGKGWQEKRCNDFGIAAWKGLIDACEAAQAGSGDRKSDAEMVGLPLFFRQKLTTLKPLWPLEADLPCGHIHADLFPDNVFFNEKDSGEVSLSGFIDFYFACTDFLALDLAVSINAWCFEKEENPVFRNDLAKKILEGYHSVRPLEACEKTALPFLCQGMALRFALTRFLDWMRDSKNSLIVPKSPLPYVKRLLFFEENPVFNALFM